MTRGAVHTTCPYCGVGCGVVALPDGRVTADTAHPANIGRLCSKGAALAETLNESGRLTQPLIGNRPAAWDAALGLVAARLAQTVAMHGPDSVALYVSGQCLTEDYYVANKLMKGFIGSANIDSNSRLCMASAVAGHVRAFGEDVVPGVYEDFDEAELIVFAGSNAAWCHPVLHQRALAARARGARIVVLDPRRTATAEASDLHLPLASGSDVMLFNGLLAYLDASGAIDHAWVARHTGGLDAALDAARQDAPDVETAAASCGVDPEALEMFYAWFAGTERVVTAWSQGVNQSRDGTDKVNAIINCHLATGRIGRPGMGPFSLTGQPNAMGGREVGGLANQLAAHLSPMGIEDRETLCRFWKAPNLAQRAGLKAVELFDAVLDGRVKALWIVGTNPAVSMPRAGRVRDALAACPFVVVSDCWPTDTTRAAHVVLPAAGWGEKDGTVTNSERRISRQRPLRAPPGEARPDWWMLAETGRRMGWPHEFAWDKPADVFREHAALSGVVSPTRRLFDISALAALDDAGYDALRPVRWPLPRGNTGEGGRLFAEGGFPTPDGRARLVPTPFGGRTARGAPFLLNTGRVRDQWHTMTRTGRVPALLAHTPEPRLAIHPADAARLDLGPDDLVRIETADGSALLGVELRHAQRHGEVFAPMHWTDAFASGGPVGRVVGAFCDPLSGQPEMKATPMRLTAVKARIHGLLLRRDPSPPPPGHWVRIPLPEGEMFRLTETMPAALESLRAAWLPVPDDAELLQMQDGRRGVLRAALLMGGVLVAALFLAPERAALPPPGRVAPLLGRPVPEASRAGLLAGLSPAEAAEDGPHVCTCFAIGRDTVRHAVVTHGLGSIAAIGRHLRAGTNCGSCIPELEEILRDVRVPAA